MRLLNFSPTLSWMYVAWTIFRTREFHWWLYGRLTGVKGTFHYVLFLCPRNRVEEKLWSLANYNCLHCGVNWMNFCGRAVSGWLHSCRSSIVCNLENLVSVAFHFLLWRSSLYLNWRTQTSIYAVTNICVHFFSSLRWAVPVHGVKLNTVRHKMKVDNAVEDAGEVGTVAGGVTFEWLRQVRICLEVTSWMANENENWTPFDSRLFHE